MEARAREYLRDDGAGPADAGPAAAGPVDMSSFPLLLLHHIPLAGTGVLERAQGELDAMLATLPTDSPLLAYATRQRGSLEKELSKRSAAARVERMILGLERVPSVASLPVHGDNNGDNGNRAVGTVPPQTRRASSSNLEPSFVGSKVPPPAAVPADPSFGNSASNPSFAATASTDNTSCATTMVATPDRDERQSKHSRRTVPALFRHKAWHQASAARASAPEFKRRPLATEQCRVLRRRCR